MQEVEPIAPLWPEEALEEMDKETRQKYAERFLFYHQEISDGQDRAEAETNLPLRTQIGKKDQEYKESVFALLEKIAQAGKESRSLKALQIIDNPQLTPQEKLEKLNGLLNQWEEAIRIVGKAKSSKVPLGLAKERLGQAANPESKTGLPDFLEETVEAEKHLWSQVK
jgi:hypothetical protein